MRSPFRNTVRKITVGVALAGLASCASYQNNLDDYRKDLHAGEPAKAAEKIREKAWADGDDQVVYLFEYGTAEQIAKDYAASEKAFLRAEDLTDIKDYHSISRVAGSLVLNQGIVQYKGDDFEKVMVNAFLAINYLMQGKYEDARVECRKLNDKLYKFRFEGKRNYEQNPFAFYLSAMIWEADRDWDTAYIDYKKAYELNPSVPYLREDLIRAAKNANRDEDLAQWRNTFGAGKPADTRKLGEVVLIYQQGWGPTKKPNPAFPKIPKLYPVSSGTVRARLEVERGTTEMTQTVFDVTDTAMKSLDEQFGGIVGMRLAGLGTKAVIADQIRQKNAILGELAWIGMNLADRADLRQWISLPATIQVAKLRLAPGSYRVRAVGVNAGGFPTGETGEWEAVEIKAAKKQFLNWRSLK